MLCENKEYITLLGGANMGNNILVEICCGSLLDAMEAQKGGADRIELNSSLFFGGLTPSAGTIAQVKEKLSVPTMVMIRPRGVGFCYTDEEIYTMERDIDIAIGLGADGLVFGILNEDGTVDVEKCRRLIKRCEGRDIIFHKAFDVTPDPFLALDQIIDLGFDRILTSGQEKTAYDGIPMIRELIERSKDQIEILPGGGIRQHNVVEICKQTGCTQVHMGPLRDISDYSAMKNSNVRFTPSELPKDGYFQVVDRTAVEEICSLVKAQ